MEGQPLLSQPLLHGDAAECPAPAAAYDAEAGALTHRPLPLREVARCRRALARCGLGALRRNQMHIYFSLLFVYLAFMVYEVNYSYFVLYEIENGDTRKAASTTTMAYIFFTMGNVVRFRARRRPRLSRDPPPPQSFRARSLSFAPHAARACPVSDASLDVPTRVVSCADRGRCVWRAL